MMGLEGIIHVLISKVIWGSAITKVVERKKMAYRKCKEVNHSLDVSLWEFFFSYLENVKTKDGLDVSI